MPYPDSPFESNFDDKILCKLANDDDETTVNENSNNQILSDTLKWLCQSPKITSFRVNTLKSNTDEVFDLIKKRLFNVLGSNSNVKIEHHPDFNDTIVIKHPESNPNLNIYNKEVVVDTICAAAVLRGAHIYAPGVMAMLAGTQINDQISVYVDIHNKCKKGLQKPFDGSKIFIANGIVKMDRHLLFSNNEQTGVAIEITENIANCPPLGDNYLPQGFGLLQNLPSIICVHVLAPQPGETILDMCAAPGNKTTHISALMNNTGKLLAIDKTPGKVAQLKKRCDDFGAKVEVFLSDSTKILENATFSNEYFDRILLDAPCSALGKRPQFANTTKPKVLRSYIPLQRKLFANAVGLLKTGGVLVYSTCTITLSENEGIVAWALKTFPNIKLVKSDPIHGGTGLNGTTLTKQQLKLVQRFGPNQEIDSVVFFIAKFIKQ